MNSLVSAMHRDLDASFSPITVYRLAISPDDAVSRCVGLWKMKGIRSETVGMREQFKQRGWSGTELVIGHSGGRVQLSVYPSFCLKGLMHDE